MLVLENGAYGVRIGQILNALGIQTKTLKFPEDEKVDVKMVEEELMKDQSFTNVAMVHSETSSGVLNPIKEIGVLVEKHLPGEGLIHSYSFNSNITSLFGLVWNDQPINTDSVLTVVQMPNVCQTLTAFMVYWKKKKAVHSKIDLKFLSAVNWLRHIYKRPLHWRHV